MTLLVYYFKYWIYNNFFNLFKFYIVKFKLIRYLIYNKIICLINKVRQNKLLIVILWLIKSLSYTNLLKNRIFLR